MRIRAYWLIFFTLLIYLIPCSAYANDDDWQWEYVVTRTTDKNEIIVYSVATSPNKILSPSEHIIIYYMSAESVGKDIRAIMQMAANTETEQWRIEDFLVIDTKSKKILNSDRIPSKWQDTEYDSPPHLCLIQACSKILNNS